jgi:hypothetical protein
MRPLRSFSTFYCVAASGTISNSRKLLAFLCSRGHEYPIVTALDAFRSSSLTRHLMLAGLVLSFLFLGQPTFAQVQVSAQAPIQDPQAVTVLAQALSVAGGLAVLSGIRDFNGSGTITYYQPSIVEGTVAVSGTNMDQFRQDVTLSTGVHSEIFANEQVTLRNPDGTIIPLSTQGPLCPGRLVVPYLLLAPALNSSGFSLRYEGLTQLDGQTVNQIELQEIIPGLTDPSGQFAEYHTVDFFIDASNFHILAMQDRVPTHLVRQVRFSDYQVVDGVLVPFSIAETSGGLQTWTIQLNQIGFNSGTQPSSFQF